MMSAPPVTPLEARLASASEATLVPTVALKVAAPRSGIVDRGGERGGGRRLVGARLEADAELLQHVVGVGQHVDQMRDRRALVAGHIGHAGLQQRLGDGEDAFAAEFLAGAEPELLDLFLERSFRHGGSFAACCVRVPRLTSGLRHGNYIQKNISPTGLLVHHGAENDASHIHRRPGRRARGRRRPRPRKSPCAPSRPSPKAPNSRRISSASSRR